MPALTVLLPAYNAQPTLAAAISSLMRQTFRDFQVVVLDDGSTDATPDIVQAFARGSARVRLSRTEQNQGIVATLNRGLDEADTPWVARMDADDLALPKRFELQTAAAQAFPAAVVIGGQAIYMGARSGPLRVPLSPASIKARLPSDNPLVHPTVLMNKAWLATRNLRYRPEDQLAEDYGLWLQVAEHGGQMANLPDTLLRYRVHAASTSQCRREAQEAVAVRLRTAYLASRGLTCTPELADYLATRMFTGAAPNLKDVPMLRALSTMLAALPELGPPLGVRSLYERGRAMASALPRPQSLAEKKKLAGVLFTASPAAAGVFVPMFLRGSP
jgi:hypothetical protein